MEIVFLWLFAAFIATLLIVSSTIFWKDFSISVKTVKLEIMRTEGEEQAYFKRELKALYLSLIPGISPSKARDIAHKGHRY